MVKKQELSQGELTEERVREIVREEIKKMWAEHARIEKEVFPHGFTVPLSESYPEDRAH